MAFKKVQKRATGYEDIESLFRDLKTNGIESLYSHQADIIRDYQANAITKDNVAIELPTGSGKTLIGLLIGEYSRLKFNDRVLYLCPTKQLVHQVVNLSNKNYGIHATAFVDSKWDYSPSKKTLYRNSATIAVTTYSSLFNINPFFKDSTLIILDDSHTSENYIASNWTISINRREYESIYKSLIELIGKNIDLFTYKKMMSDQINPSEMGWVYLYDFQKYYNDIVNIHELLDPQASKHNFLRFKWQNIKNHLHACNFYYSWEEIVIRPLIPPSLENNAFAEARHRIFMSATLGNGGDLERMSGLKNFYRIPIPSGWEKQGLGRRYFNFPNLSLQNDEISELIVNLINRAKKAVLLVSTTKELTSTKKYLEQNLKGFSILEAKETEVSKDAFNKVEKAVVVLANRFDGIDFPGEDCRLLIVSAIPYVANAQERYIQANLNASVLFYDRNRTRLIQAIGRCTRSPKDYSAVFVVGEGGLSDWLMLHDRHQYLHPEFQAEIKFGLTNSEGVDKESFKENFNFFLQQGEEWEDANDEIIEIRSTLQKKIIPGQAELESSVSNEIDFLYLLWERNYEAALQSSVKILDCLAGGKELKGYRALWNYLAASVSYQLFKNKKEEQYKELTTKYLNQAATLSSAFRLNFNVDGFSNTYKQDLINLITIIFYGPISGYANRKRCT